MTKNIVQVVQQTAKCEIHGKLFSHLFEKIVKATVYLGKKELKTRLFFSPSLLFFSFCKHTVKSIHKNDTEL